MAFHAARLRVKEIRDHAVRDCALIAALNAHRLLYLRNIVRHDFDAAAARSRSSRGRNLEVAVVHLKIHSLGGQSGDCSVSDREFCAEKIGTVWPIEREGSWRRVGVAWRRRSA